MQVLFILFGKSGFLPFAVFSDFLAEKDLLGYYLPIQEAFLCSTGDRNAVRVNNEMLSLKYYTTKIVESREG